MSLFVKRSAQCLFWGRSNVWRGLATGLPANEVELQHMDGDLEGVAVIGLQRAAAKNSFR